MKQPDALVKVARAAEAAADRKAEDLVALDVRGLTSFADVFLLATGRSTRQVRSIADAVEEAALALGEKPLGIEGYGEGRWILLDLGDVIVHVFEKEVRDFYDLERLWSEAPALELLDASAGEGDP
jgi:ribosome-associated protein